MNDEFDTEQKGQAPEPSLERYSIPGSLQNLLVNRRGLGVERL
ncbi:hypothetical protein [Microvirga pakistanensis]|nr:hypothetical protein [Microvirga pakistanensis]